MLPLIGEKLGELDAQRKESKDIAHISLSIFPTSLHILSQNVIYCRVFLLLSIFVSESARVFGEGRIMQLRMDMCSGLMV